MPFPWLLSAKLRGSSCSLEPPSRQEQAGPELKGMWLVQYGDFQTLATPKTPTPEWPQVPVPDLLKLRPREAAAHTAPATSQGLCLVIGSVLVLSAGHQPRYLPYSLRQVPV